MIYLCDSEDLKKSWDKLIDTIHEFYEALDNTEKTLENMDDGEDDNSAKFDAEVSLIKQSHLIMERLQNITNRLESADNKKYEEVKDTITSHKTYEEHIEELMQKHPKGKIYL